MNKKKYWKFAIGLALTSLIACSEDKGSNSDEDEDKSSVQQSSVQEDKSSVKTSSSVKASSVATSSSVAASSSSVTPSSSSVVETACAAAKLSGTIDEDTKLCAKTTYELDGYVMVENEAVLTIEAGTKIASAGKSALIVMPDAKIIAVGTKEKPIVFTSKNTTPAAGDWAGVVLFGNAPVSTTDNTQGFEADPSLVYGGTDDEDSSGVLKYVRIEYAGWTVATDKELNGLTLGGVGARTEISYIQVHAGSDDAIEFFGGNVDIDHSIVTAYEDDGWDIDCGWQGSITYGINIQGANSDRAIEAGSVAIDQNHITEGTFENLTVVKNAKNQAIHVKDNVAIVVKKSVFVGGQGATDNKSAEFVRLEGDVAIDQVNQADPLTYFTDVFHENFTTVAYAGAYEVDGNGKVVKYYKDADGAKQVCPSGSLPTGAPAGAKCEPKVVRDDVLEEDLSVGLTAGTGLINEDLSTKAATAKTAGAGAVIGTDLWYEGWTKTGTMDSGL